MKPIFTLLLLLPFLVFAQDTLTFGGVYDLPGAEVRATYTPVSRLASQFTVEEVYRLPGTFYDPARLVALLPGVVQTNDQANHLSVRGNTPNANLWRINGLAIVNPNHTANAGTFYDFPTLNGGGVNAISAQVLDNSGFLSYGLPLEYGNATGGTFDLRLRPGKKILSSQQAQAGFIGFDGTAEGPIGLLGNTSYLVNARYSFTGLLADMGVDFGGESIRFADLNAHLHHKWERGEASVFAIGGASSNRFAFPEEEEVTEQKELFDIDFESNLLITGITANHWFGKRLKVSGGVGYSSTNANRDQRFREGDNELLSMVSGENLLSQQVKLSYPLGEGITLELGQEYLNRKVEAIIPLGRRTRSPDASSTAVFTGLRIDQLKTEFNLGVRGVIYKGPNVDAKRLEPRLYASRRFGRQRITLSAEGMGRLPTTAMMLNTFGNPINAPTTWQSTLRYGRKLLGATVAASVFYQQTPNENVIRREFFFISANNFLEVDPDYAFTTTSTTRRYGVELEAAGGRRVKGWYYRGNLTLLKAETQQQIGGWTDDRYAMDFIGKLTIGREWAGTDKLDRKRTYGLNLALISHGGERLGIVERGDAGTFEPYFATPRLTDGLVNTAGTYFRPDLRLYKTKVRARTTTTLALDVQNAAGIENTANVYYDAFLERPNERLQLGLIPVLSYRIVWR